MKFAFGFSTFLALLAGAASGNVFEDDAHPSNNGKGRGPPDANTNQANGRRRGPLGGVTPGASAADCARPLDIKLYADSPSSIRFRPDPRACRSGAAFAGASDDGHSHVTLVPGRGNNGSFRASVVDDVTGAVYSIQPDANGEMEVVERMQEDYGPELDPEDIIPPSERRLLESRLAAKSAPEPAAGLRGKVANQLKELGDSFLSENDQGHRSLQTPTVMDVLVLWTSYAECRNSGKARTCTDLSTTTENNIRGLIDLAITETNTAYTLSGVNAELNLIHAAPTTYVESGGFSPSLSDLRNGVVQGADLRSVYGADMVALIIDDPQYCGIAYLGPSYNSMFSVTAWNCATGYYSFGHEIGHNQGCNHDRGTSNACSNTEYRYGYRDPQANFRSILAYNCNSGQCDGNAGGGCTRVGRFSNNYGYQWNGQAIGNAQNDNARRINDVKDTIAAYETACPTCTPNPTPSPTTPPPTPSPTPCPPTGCTTPSELTTTFNDNNGSAGNTFKIVAKKDIEIAGFDVHNSGTGSIPVQVWHRAGDYAGSEGSSTGWTQILSTSVTAAGGGVATVLPEFGSRVSVAAGATHSFHIHTGTNHRYTNGGTEGNMYTENTDLAFYEGKGCGGVFSCTFSPRVFNGAIKYFNAPAGTPGPTNPPSPSLTKFPTNQPTPLPTKQPTTQPTNPPTTAPTPQPTGAPSESPSKGPTGSPITESPTTSPSRAPSKSPSTSPTPSPSKAPVPAPTDNPTTSPSRAPSTSPSVSPSRSPSKAPVPEPTGNPTSSPTKQPTNEPTPQPTDSPTLSPVTAKPTASPSKNPTGSPSTPPSLSPSKEPTPPPTKAPVTPNPTNFPTASPTNNPTKAPTVGPTGSPSKKPTPVPTNAPTPSPTSQPTDPPTSFPTQSPVDFNCVSIAEDICKADGRCEWQKQKGGRCVAAENPGPTPTPPPTNVGGPPSSTPPPTPPTNQCVPGAPGAGGRNDPCDINEDCSSCNCKSNGKCSG